jgi:Amino acid permease
MNAVVLSSAISAGNHALFAGTRVLYGLAQASQAPSLFAWTTREGVPLPAMLLTSSFSVLCFGSSFIGSGQLWAWLQNLVGVSNQVRLCHAVFFCQGVDARAFLGRAAWHVDRVVVDRDCVVAISCRVEDARQTALGDEVPCAVDVAVGPSFRGAHKLFSFPTYSPSFLASHVSLTKSIDGLTARQIIAVSAIILGE